MVWFGTFFGAILSKLFDFLVTKIGLVVSSRVTISTAYIVLSGTVFIQLVIFVKAAVLLMAVTLPDWARPGLIFLPSNLHLVIPFIITLKSGVAIYRWTMFAIANYHEAAKP